MPHAFRAAAWSFVTTAPRARLLLDPFANPSRAHLNSQERAASCDVQRSLVGTAKRQILAAPRNAPHRDDAEMLPAGAHHFNTRLRERIHAPLVVEHEAVGVGNRRFSRRNRLVANDIGGELAPTREPA